MLVMSENIRAFIAADIPEHIRSALADIQGRLKKDLPGIKWVKPETIHLTLKFLGDISLGCVAPVQEAMASAAAGVRPFDLMPGGVGAFPGFHRPRVIWVGLKGETAALLALQRRIEDALVPAGFESEKKRFKGHLTIGRVKGGIDPVRLIDSTGGAAKREVEPFTVGRMVLYRSQLKPTGAVYTTIHQQMLIG